MFDSSIADANARIAETRQLLKRSRVSAQRARALITEARELLTATRELMARAHALMHNAPMPERRALPINVIRGVHPYADHVTVTFKGEPVTKWHEADEINGWLVLEPGPSASAPMRFGHRGDVVVTLNDDAPADVREAYELARWPLHLRR